MREVYLLALGLFFFLISSAEPFNEGSICNGKLINLTGPSKGKHFTPLSNITIQLGKAKGSVSICDSKGNEYIKMPHQEQLSFTIAGALGTHTVYLKDEKGLVIDKATFKVDCKTQINDEGGTYKKILDMLYWSMIGDAGGEAIPVTTVRIDNQFYTYFVPWLRDHVHTMKGMKYFYHDLQSAIDLYANYQREDGMIWDNINTRTPGVYNHWQNRFDYGGFFRSVDSDRYEFHRIAVEGLYYTWKATGDDIWMKSRLDNALLALKYITTDKWRWSQKYQLVKRGYTIDTWDFQNSEDAKIGGNGDAMVITDKTRFNIMFGDNTGLAASCNYLSEMLKYANRIPEAEKVALMAKDIMNNLNKTSWNGNFFTHQVPEDQNVKRDLGVDLNSQVSLSNAYSLNRNIEHDQAVAIIKKYLQIKSNMPASSPGEWYTIYPPFEKGFGGHNSMWDYMNGGVTSIVAGELAHGAFEHGYEKYAVDILLRIKDLSAKTNDYLNCTYKGALPAKPIRNFTSINLASVANIDVNGKGAPGVIGWTGEGENDLHQFPTGENSFFDVPFDIVDPEKNGRKCVLGLSSRKGYKISEKISVNNKAASLYFLHTTNGDNYPGNIIIHYSDSSVFTDPITPSKISNWWYPNVSIKNNQNPKAKVAWRGENKLTKNVGVIMYGLNNPFPDKTIDSIEFQALHNNAVWIMLGLTLSDYPVFFESSIVSYGIPDNWGAAANVYALIEGLAGVKDLGTSYSNALIAPRWSAANVNKADVTVRYPASDGYVSYQYQYNDLGKKLDLTYTGSANNNRIKILLPSGKQVDAVYLNGALVSNSVEKIENSEYLVLNIENNAINRISCVLK